MRDKRKAKNCLISRQQAGYKYRFHVPLILNGIGGILFAPLAQMDKSTRLLIGWPWVRAPYGAYAEVAEWHTHRTKNPEVQHHVGPNPTFCTYRLKYDRRFKEMNLPSIDMTATGQNIRRLRRQAGLSVKDLQDIFGFATPQAIYKWQQGTALPAIDNLVALAAILRVSLDEILVINPPIRLKTAGCNARSINGRYANG